MRTPVLFDGTNVWDASRVRALGFTYYGVGRLHPREASPEDAEVTDSKGIGAA